MFEVLSMVSTAYQIKMTLSSHTLAARQLSAYWGLHYIKRLDLFCMAVYSFHKKFTNHS